jgi:two-component system phosphate regulon response regulator PhoB
VKSPEPVGFLRSLARVLRREREEKARMPRVLVVEDEEALAILLRYNLEAEGFEVIEAASGAEAERKAGATCPDLILLDWVLPGLTGIELCRRLRLRAETRHIPILLLTAKTEASDRQSGLDAGADDFIIKPFSLSEVLRRIHLVLERSRHRPANGQHKLLVEQQRQVQTAQRPTPWRRP